MPPYDQSPPSRLTTKLGELCLSFVFLLVVTLILSGIGWGLFQAARGLVWTAGVAASYVGAVGWIIAVPLVALAIYETVSRFKPNAAAASTTSEPDTRAAKPSRGRARGLLCAGSAAVIMSGSLCLNIAAARIDAHYQNRKQQGVDIYKNHDLAKLVGQCVRLAILRHADLLPNGDERSALETIAAIAPARWAAMTDDSDGKQVDTRVLALADTKLTRFIQEPRAEALHQAEWISLLTDWRAEAEISSLSDATLAAAAGVIARDFGITLREALKADFERGGKAWPAMQLDIAQQLLNRTPVSMSVDNSEIGAALAEIKGLLADDAMGLPALRRTVLDARQAQDKHAREVVARFDRVELSLLHIQGDVNAVRDGMVSIKDDTSAIRHGVQETTKHIKDVKSLVAGLRLSPDDWKAHNSETMSASDTQTIERDYGRFLSARLLGNSVPYFQAQAPLRYRAWRRGAEAGNPMAQVLVALSFGLGTGVAHNESESLAWLERAADQGNPQGLYSLGWMHEYGKGGAPESPANAARLYDAAAELGDTSGIIAVARGYRWGLNGKPIDTKLALTWYNRAIDKGDTRAMCDAAEMHDGGELGKDEDPALSERLYRRAAEAGNQEAKGVLAGRVVGAACEAYAKADATAEQKEAALHDAQTSLSALDALNARALVKLLADAKLRPALDVIKSADANDPMRVVHQKVVDLLIARFKAADLITREDMLNDFANATADTVVGWSSAGQHRKVVDLYKKCFADINVASLHNGERDQLVRLLAASISSLYAVGYRDDATKLADETYQMTEAILEERPWDWYVRQNSLGIGWNAGASLIEQGEPEKAQLYLRKSWQTAFWIDGRDDLLQKYPTLPVKGGVPPGATPEDSEYFQRFAAKPTPEDGKTATPDDKPKKGGMKRFTVPVDFNGTKYPFHIYVLSGRNGYKQVQDQFIWVKEYRGGIVPTEVEDSFRRLNKIAVENNVDFMELCVYALGPATDENTKQTDE